jgi:phage repressor protein C with HTH and peptisase S24 domain
MGLGKRIAHYRAKAGLTLEQLEDLSGVATGTIHALEKRDSARSQFFPALAKAFGLTMEQLADETTDYPLSIEIFGTEEMQAAAAKHPSERTPIEKMLAVARADKIDSVLYSRSGDHVVVYPKVAEAGAAYGMAPILAWDYEDDLPPGEFVMVPRLDVKLSAGNGTGHNQVEIEFARQAPQAFRAEWIRAQHLKPKKLAAMTASGDSMEPSIYNSDSLLVDTGQVEVLDGKVYALWYDGGERVKRLYRMPGGGLRIKSDNPAYDPIVLGPDYAGHVRILGRVVHRSGMGGL